MCRLILNIAPVDTSVSYPYLPTTMSNRICILLGCMVILMSSTLLASATSHSPCHVHFKTFDKCAADIMTLDENYERSSTLEEEAVRACPCYRAFAQVYKTSGTGSDICTKEFEESPRMAVSVKHSICRMGGVYNCDDFGIGCPALDSPVGV